MDPRDFDRLARTAAQGFSRRGVLGWLGKGSAASLLGAAGLAAASHANAAQTKGLCTLHITGTVRLGPSMTQRVTPKDTKNGELKGDLSFVIGPQGAVLLGALVLADGTKFPVVGQIAGSAVSLRIMIAKGRVVILVGTAAQDLSICGGEVDGLLTGPQAGDIGDWNATAVGTTAGVTTAAPTQVSTGQGAVPTPTTAAPAPATGGGCPAGLTSCAVGANATCVNTNTAEKNCGACGTVCPANQVCDIGKCSATCTNGTTCGTACIDTSSDPANCGACGTACAANEGCCAGACLSLLNETNCGACGVVCTAQQSCQNGQCAAANACPNGIVCGGNCVDGKSDPANCGACGTACGQGQTCQAGQCAAPACPNGQTDCGNGACADLTSDLNNCGLCGSACPAGQECHGGACACPAGQTVCAGKCVDLTNDNANCGTCGIACAGGQTCVGGGCVTPVACARPASTSSYVQSCTTVTDFCTSGGTVLGANCAPGNTNLQVVFSTINVNNCAAQNFVISNCGGILTCGGC